MSPIVKVTCERSERFDQQEGEGAFESSAPPLSLMTMRRPITPA